MCSEERIGGALKRVRRPIFHFASEAYKDTAPYITLEIQIHNQAERMLP